MRFLNSVVCSIVLFILFSLSRSAATQSYNAGQNFSATNNPNGQWSYGWSPTSGSTFNLLPNTTLFMEMQPNGPLA